MAGQQETRNMALFCDFENIALGVRDARYEKFDINRVLERLLLKGSIVVKKAYCDWERYKEFKAAMHSASFELIEIPHLRQSGKNSADIRMVVDALDLCYTKSHVDTFGIISGDSDFSPLVSKLRENAKIVIGVGVKNSTSDLLIANCDEFIFYDDLVREDEAKKRRAKKSSGRVPVGEAKKEAKKGDKAEKTEKAERSTEDRKHEAIELVLETVDALGRERAEEEKVWGSMVKQAIKRRSPGFSESYYGFRAFGDLLEEARRRGLLELKRDEKSGGYVVRAVPRKD
ncbi:MAG: NYN domain-containing protein [Betaproteobacteria bacterium RIFCSPLOWO2_12_FULL_63_13]|nr:MAG: NYN domain-containing protein [Betaproteobacteria bacterium RIFCSPLOWO2_12_FULL_63_13]